MDDIEIEVFRADTQASRGITAAHLAEVAEFDCEAHPIPNVLGHPAADKPAIDRVRGFRVEGSSLFAKVPATAKKIWDGIKSGEIVNRSMAFFDPSHEANPTPGKWAPRHLGWISTAAGIPGMEPLHKIVKSLAFAADGETLEVLGAPADAVVYAPAPTGVRTIFEAKEPVTVELTPEQIAENERIRAATEALDKRELAFAAREKSQFEAANTSIVDSLVTAGKVIPSEAGALKLVFNALDRNELEFGAADKSDKASASSKLAAFLFAALPGGRVPIDQERKSPPLQFDANTAGVKTGDDAVATAKRLVSEGKAPTFEAACEMLDRGNL